MNILHDLSGLIIRIVFLYGFGRHCLNLEKFLKLTKKINKQCNKRKALAVFKKIKLTDFQAEQMLNRVFGETFDKFSEVLKSGIQLVEFFVHDLK